MPPSVQVGVRILELRTALAERVIALEEALSQVEHYIAGHTKAQFTHSICPQCRDTIVRPQIEARRGKSLG